MPERIGQTSKDFKPKEKQCFQQTKMVKEKSRTVDRERCWKQKMKREMEKKGGIIVWMALMKAIELKSLKKANSTINAFVPKVKLLNPHHCLTSKNN